MQMTFDLLVQKTNEKLDSLKKENRFLEFTRILERFYPTAQALFPKETEEALIKTRAFSFMKKIREENKNTLARISGFDVRKDGHVLIRDEVGTRLSKFVDINDTVMLLFKNEKNVDNLILSFFSGSQNFIEVQLYFSTNNFFKKTND